MKNVLTDETILDWQEIALNSSVNKPIFICHEDYLSNKKRFMPKFLCEILVLIERYDLLTTHIIISTDLVSLYEEHMKYHYHDVPDTLWGAKIVYSSIIEEGTVLAICNTATSDLLDMAGAIGKIDVKLMKRMLKLKAFW